MQLMYLEQLNKIINKYSVVYDTDYTVKCVSTKIIGINLNVNNVEDVKIVKGCIQEW